MLSYSPVIPAFAVWLITLTMAEMFRLSGTLGIHLGCGVFCICAPLVTWVFRQHWERLYVFVVNLKYYFTDLLGMQAYLGSNVVVVKRGASLLIRYLCEPR